MFTCNGILFNHESPRGGETFVTRKIIRTVARVEAGLQDILWLGNLDARRDQGYAAEYVEARWLMLSRISLSAYPRRPCPSWRRTRTGAAVGCPLPEAPLVVASGSGGKVGRA